MFILSIFLLFQLLDNVCYDSVGHGFFLEDGGEKNTYLRGNLGLGQRRFVGTTVLDVTGAIPTDAWVAVSLTHPTEAWVTVSLKYSQWRVSDSIINTFNWRVSDSIIKTFNWRVGDRIIKTLKKLAYVYFPSSCRTVALRKKNCWQTGMSTKIFRRATVLQLLSIFSFSESFS